MGLVERPRVDESRCLFSIYSTISHRGTYSRLRPADAAAAQGFAWEYTTLGWNVGGVVVLAFTAIAARSVALASVIEIGASTVVI
jgi:hypothetical protein